MLDPPQLAGTAHAGLHLVVDVEDAVLLAARLEPTNELGRHHRKPALALHRLQDHARHTFGVDGRLEHPVELGERILGGDIPIGIRRGRAIHLGGERPHAALVDELGGQRQSQQRATVKAAVKRDHSVAIGRIPGDLDRVFDRFGSRVHQQRLLGVCPGRVLAQQLAHVDIRGVAGDREAGVQQGIGLVLDRGHDSVGGMPQVDHPDAAGEVQILLAVDIRELGAVGTLSEDRLDRDALSDVPVTLLAKSFGTRT